eukprot:COSAG01_NODE_2820_length_7012_cov_5.502965_7_plen_321_part_00
MPEDYLPGNGYGKVKVYSATSATSENPVPATSATSEPAALAVATAAADIIDASSSLCLAAGLLYVLLYYCNVARRRAVAAAVRAVPSPPVMSPCGSGSCCFPRAPPLSPCVLPPGACCERCLISACTGAAAAPSPNAGRSGLLCYHPVRHDRRQPARAALHPAPSDHPLADHEHHPACRNHRQAARVRALVRAASLRPHRPRYVAPVPNSMRDCDTCCVLLLHTPVHIRLDTQSPGELSMYACALVLRSHSHDCDPHVRRNQGSTAPNEGTNGGAATTGGVFSPAASPVADPEDPTHRRRSRRRSQSPRRYGFAQDPHTE